MKLHYWLEAFTLGGSRRRNDVRVIGRFEARLSTAPQATKVSDASGDWEWPGEDVGTAELRLTDGEDVPDAVHVLAHYHDNYFDCVHLFTDLKEAKAKFAEVEQELWEEVRHCKYQPDGNGLIKMSRYHCGLVSYDDCDAAFTNPDKGSTWMLLPYVLIEG